MKKTIFYFLIIVTGLLSNFMFGAIPASERAALIALYNSTNGDGWTNNSGWKTPPLHADGFAMPGTEGTWFGVTLTGDHVTKLDLGENNICGVIPPGLADLSNLEHLILSGNQLEGSIPSQLGNLTELQCLLLNSNQLSGAIPSQLGSLSNLLQLDLYQNQLGGAIPSKLSNLSNLKFLDLRQNQLSGSIPSQLGNLGNLKLLDLCDNQLSGGIPSELGNLSNLQELNLKFNTLNGKIPSSLINLTQIVFCSIDFNCLYTTDPGLIAWLDHYDLGWEATQNRCSAVTTIPTITTNSVSSITSNSAVCGGNVSSNGGAPVTSRGVCWSTSLNPTRANSKTINGIGIGSFTGYIIGLNPNTTYYARAYATNSKGTAYGSNMNFTTTSCPGIPGIGLNHTALDFGASIPGTVTGPQTVLVSNTGSGTLNWSASGSAVWLSFSPSSGTGDSALSVSIDLTGLAVGSYTGTITITDPNAVNSPQAITVSLHVYDQGETTPPFGEFSTPLDGVSIYNSVPVTGWVLDDIGVADVKIYNDDAYIGDALFVEGARPDVETSYPTYPNNYKAGWGYMLLTNCLPDGGNGTYTLTAKATDMEGNEVTLGSKTITIDNDHAVKPFGAIDTPIQGGTASGNKFINNGWVITPQPNMIPEDGSTIDVVIDGVVKGHPKYNIYRWDIAWFFPGYANSDGAAGYYYIDTTKLKNGVHTIAWTVTDSGGNSDGIGSRYFTVQNSGTGDMAIKSFDQTFSKVWPPAGYLIEIKELERVEINLSGEGVFEGYLVVGNQLRELPIGSTLDRERSVFYWQPGPGFVGEYRFVFIEKANDGQLTRKNIVVNIKPMHMEEL